MSANKILPFESPVGDLEWVFTTGEGKKDLKGNFKYQANVVVPTEVGKTLEKRLAEFWKEHKPKGSKEPKSTGLYKHTVLDKEATAAEGENIYKETGKYFLCFKTGTKYVSGDKKLIKIFNSKGNEVSLHGKKIGNGSRGRLIGSMAIYDVSVAARGVTFYLDSIQLSKFVEYTGGSDPSGAIDPEEGDFEGVEGELSGIEEGENTETVKPRL